MSSPPVWTVYVLNPYLLFLVMYVLYGVGTITSVVYFNRQKPRDRVMARRTLFSGVIVQTLYFISMTIFTGDIPIDTPRHGLMAFAWGAFVVYLILDRQENVPTAGAFLSPIAFAVMLLALVFPAAAASPPSEATSHYIHTLGAVHIVLAFMGNGAFILAFAAGVMYLLQERELKSRRPGSFFQRLPSLEDLDGLGYRCLVAGFPLLTLAIITGALWQNALGQGYWNWDPKSTWTLATWVLYASLLGARVTVGWRGRRTAWFAIAGFGCVVATSIAVSVFLVERNVIH